MTEARCLAAGRAETRAPTAERGDAQIVDTLDPAGLARLGAVEIVETRAVPVPRVVALEADAGHPLLADPRAGRARPRRRPRRRRRGDLATRHAIPRSRVNALLDGLGVAQAMLARRPGAVSGGELQRIALARVIALAPAVILADEPTSRVAPVSRRRVMAAIAEAAEAARAAVLLVTHARPIADRWAHRRPSLALARGGWRSDGRGGRNASAPVADDRRDCGSRRPPRRRPLGSRPETPRRAGVERAIGIEPTTFSLGS